MGFDMGFNIMSLVIPVIIGITFILVIGLIIVAFVRTAQEGVKNNHSPKVTANATVVNKRQQIRGEHTHTYYFATFQFETGDRTEFTISGEASGMLIQGDTGKLTFQGTRFISFDRL